MGNFNDRTPDETYLRRRDLVLYDVIYNRYREMEPGDMIQYHRGRYEHWAVYIGNGKVIQVTVHDFGGSVANTIVSISLAMNTLGRQTAVARITEENFHDVLGEDGKARINNFKDRTWDVLPANCIVQCARSCLGREGYNVLENNCEHFATECRYGKRLSGQEEAFWSTATLGAYQRE